MVITTVGRVEPTPRDTVRGFERDENTKLQDKYRDRLGTFALFTALQYT